MGAGMCSSDKVIDFNGGVAKWLCSGLQSRVRRFDPDPRLQIPILSYATTSAQVFGRAAGVSASTSTSSRMFHATSTRNQ
jgi:hypothetical protein